MFINYSYRLFLVVLFFTLSFTREKSCEELDSIITNNINQGKLDIAYNISLKNIEKKLCNYNFYYNIGNILKSFDDFNNARTAYKKALNTYKTENISPSFGVEELKFFYTINDEYKKVLDAGNKLSMLVTEVSFIRNSFLSNHNSQKAIKNYLSLIEGNNVWDQKEPYVDSNNNNKYDSSERFVDANKNNIYDKPEVFIDCGTLIDSYGTKAKICSDNASIWVDSLGNGFFDIGETFFDTNGNDIFDKGETFTDSGFDNNQRWINQMIYNFKIDTSIYSVSELSDQQVLDYLGQPGVIYASGDSMIYIPSQKPIEFSAPNPNWKEYYGNNKWDDREGFEDWNFSDIGYLYLALGDTYKRLGDFMSAIKYLKLALNQNPFIKDYKEQMNQVSKMIAKKGNNFLRLNKLEEAIKQYELSLSVDTTESVIHYNLGNAYFEKDDYLNALNSYKKVLTLDPKKYKAAYKMGVCYQKLDNHEEAVVKFRNSIGTIENLNDSKSKQDKITFWSPYNELAISLMSLNSYQEANAVLNGIIDRSPNYYKSYEALGVLYSESTDLKYKVYDFAVENFIKATKLKPNSQTIKFRLASLYNIIAEEEKESQNLKIMNKRLVEAKKYARQCLKLKKTHGGAYFELGVAELNLCNKSSGLKSLKKAAKYDRRYRSEVKRIIKKIGPIMDHCE